MTRGVTAEMASMFASLQGRLTAPHPPGPKADESRHSDGGARGGGTFPEDQPDNGHHN